MSETKTDISPENKLLIDNLIKPIITPKNKNQSPTDIINILKNTVASDLKNETSTIGLIIAVKKSIKDAERLIANGTQRKAVILYICKLVIYENVKNEAVRNLLIMTTDETLPVVIDLAIDVLNNPKEYKDKVKKCWNKCF